MSRVPLDKFRAEDDPYFEVQPGSLDEIIAKADAILEDHPPPELPDIRPIQEHGVFQEQLCWIMTATVLLTALIIMLMIFLKG